MKIAPKSVFFESAETLDSILSHEQLANLSVEQRNVVLAENDLASAMAMHGTQYMSESLCIDFTSTTDIVKLLEIFEIKPASELVLGWVLSAVTDIAASLEMEDDVKIISGGLEEEAMLHIRDTIFILVKTVEMIPESDF